MNARHRTFKGGGALTSPQTNIIRTRVKYLYLPREVPRYLGNCDIASLSRPSRVSNAARAAPSTRITHADTFLKGP